MMLTMIQQRRGTFRGGIVRRVYIHSARPCSVRSGCALCPVLCLCTGTSYGEHDQATAVSLPPL